MKYFSSLKDHTVENQMQKFEVYIGLGAFMQ